MLTDELTLEIELGLGEDVDAEEVEELTRQLHSELRELDVEAERPGDGEVPEGARGIEAAALGILVLKLGQGALASVASVLQGWLARRSSRSVKLTLGGDSIEVSGGSAVYQRQLIETFLAAHAAR